MSEVRKTEEIVAEFETRLRKNALAKMSTLDTVAIIADWRRRGDALRPFAKYAAWVSENHPGWDHDDFCVTLRDGKFSGMEANRLGAYRRARAVISDK
jgi:hypothetical protein